MRARAWSAIVVLTCLATMAVAQEGHPIVGSWSGTWSPTPKDKIPVLFVMEWKNKAIVGVMNPGLDDEAPARAVLDSANWTLHIEADSKKTPGGAPVKVVFDGKLEDIGSHNRTLTGTMSRDNLTGRLKLTRE